MAELIAQIVWRQQDRELLDVVLDACEGSLDLTEHCRFFRDPVPLGGEEAQRLRAEYERAQALDALMRERRRERENAARSASVLRGEQLAALLGRADTGDAGVWPDLAGVLALEEDGSPVGDRLFANIRSLPAWGALDTSDQGRIVTAALAYIMDPAQVTDEDNPARTGVFTSRAISGYQALVLLAGEIPGVFDALDRTAWERWLPLVLSFPLASQGGKDTAAAELTRWVYAAVPSQFLAALRSLLEWEGDQAARAFSLHALEPCWDDGIATLLAEEARDERLSLDRFSDLLAMLFDHDSAEARAYASSLVAAPTSLADDEPRRGRSRVAACTLLEYSDAATWPTLAPALHQDPAFGREVVLSLSSRPIREDRAGDGLTDEQLADLLLWLAERFPPNEDPGPPMGWVSERQRLGDWRRQLASRLAQRGTPAACEALRRVIRESPDSEYAHGLKWMLLEAEQLARERTAPPAPSPEMVLALAADRRRRLIESGEQLLDLILESLDRLERKLRGETPAAIGLWNEIPQGRGNPGLYRPKEENALSDVVNVSSG